MSIPLTTASPAAGGAAERVSELQARIHGMQRDRFAPGDHSLAGTLGHLLPQGALRAGEVYTIENSTSLVMAVLGAASSDAGWSAVVGLPDFGVEAAITFGIDLDRLVLVPDPGDQWMAVTAALVDVLPLVVVHPRNPVGDAEAARLAARLRQTGCTLIVAGAWSQSEAGLSVTGSSWEGLGHGHGYLSRRTLTVAVAGRHEAGRQRSEQVHLPDAPVAAGSGPLGYRAAIPVRANRHPATG